MLGLHFCVRAFSSCGERGPLFIAVRGPLTITASLVAEHRLQTRRLSNCGSRAQLLRGMWDPPGPGLEPVSPALAGRLSTTVPPGKPSWVIFEIMIVHLFQGQIVCSNSPATTRLFFFFPFFYFENLNSQEVTKRAERSHVPSPSFPLLALCLM